MMKKNINISQWLFAFTFLFLLSSCSEVNDAGQFNFETAPRKGASFRILEEISSSFDFSNPASAVFTIRGEFITGNKGENVKSLKVYTTFEDKTIPSGGTDNSIGTSTLVKEYSKADFSNSENGNKGATVSVTLSEALAALNLDVSKVAIGDTFTITEVIELDSGETYSRNQIGNSLRSTSYNTPLLNVVPVE